VFGEVPYLPETQTNLTGGDYEMMISKVLPFIRELYDIFELITLVSNHST